MRPGARSTKRGGHLSDIGANRLPWPAARVANNAAWGDHRDLYDDVLDVSVLVLLHAGRSRGDPPTQRRELVRVRLVAEAEPSTIQVGFYHARRSATGVLWATFPTQELANSTSLDLSLHVHSIDPEHAIHPAHVNAADVTWLILRADQRVCHRRAAAERD